MKYKYNIKHKEKNKTNIINFKNKDSMIKYLNKNKNKLNDMDAVVVNFSVISLPLKMTTWNNN
jgi:hypothetical protein